MCGKCVSTAAYKTTQHFRMLLYNTTVCGVMTKACLVVVMAHMKVLWKLLITMKTFLPPFCPLFAKLDHVPIPLGCRLAGHSWGR